MFTVQDALAAASRPVPRATASRARHVLVVGGGGALGAAVLEQLLSGRRYSRVGVLAQPALQPALRGLLPVVDDDAALAVFQPDTALIVFDRERHANGRDAAFVRPEPAGLLPLARRLHGHGVRTLLVVVPHSPALLPDALKFGLATLDEAAVAALGYERLIFMRMAQAGATSNTPGLAPPQRLAAWMLRQLHFMVPQSEQPVRAATVARVACELVLQLSQAAPGTRVLPADVLARAAQGVDVAELVGAWLAGRALPGGVATRRRW